MHSILVDIVRKKRDDLAVETQNLPLETLKEQALATSYRSSFAQSITNAPGAAIIAEIKLASPSHPNLGKPADIPKRAQAYEQAGANAVSFITERHYFKSDITYIPTLKTVTRLPILQKDFVVSEYQVYQTRLIGSDALLLIARLVSKAELCSLVSLAQDLGIEPVVEINSKEDLSKALATTTHIVAVNARDLSTFTIDIPVACTLLRAIPNRYITLGFSGITSANQVRQYISAGARGVLVGTSLMQAKDINQYIQELRG